MTQAEVSAMPVGPAQDLEGRPVFTSSNLVENEEHARNLGRRATGDKQTVSAVRKFIQASGRLRMRLLQVELAQTDLEFKDDTSPGSADVGDPGDDDQFPTPPGA